MAVESPVPASPATLDVIRRVKRNYAPPPELKISEFADRDIIVTSGPLAGTRWQTEFAPYQRGIMDAWHEPGVEIVVVKGSSQWGKTACAVNVVAYHCAHDPCTILVVEPTVDPMGKDFSKNRLEPVIAASPRLREVFGRKRSKNQSDTTLEKSFPGGLVAIAGANSAASLAARPVRVLLLDEVDRYPPELPGEGNTISIALNRTKTYRRRRRVMMLSSPTMVGASIDTWHKLGDQRRYYVPCPGCGHMHPYEWKHVRWDDHDPSTARLECPACAYRIGDAERIAILSRGEWRAEKPDRMDPAIVSFHMWEAYSPLSSLREIVTAFLQARELQKAGDNSAMHTFENTTLGEAVELERGEGVEPTGLLLRRESFGPDDVDLPEGVCCLTMGVDTQDDRLELVVVGWGLGEESWIVYRHTIPGDTSHEEPWLELESAIGDEYRHALSTPDRRVVLPIRAVAIDSAGHRTTTVYHYAALWAARRVYAIIGREGQQTIVSSPSPRRYGQGERTVPLYTFGVDAAKGLLMSRLKLTAKGPGYVHLPNAGWCDEEFAAQLTSERLKSTFERGEKRERWVKIRPRNEALDCYVYALGAFYQQQPDLKRRQKWLEELARELRLEPTTPPPVPAPKKTPWLGTPRGPWLRGNR